MSKKRQGGGMRRWLRTTNLLIAGTVIGLAALGIWVITNQDSDTALGGNSSEQTVIQMPHLHGLSFSSDGKQLLVPAHIGLVVFENNRWTIPNLPAHDYMGYAGVNDGFYSSGHPDLRTDFVNPLGLVKSTDGGKSITTLAFDGETDFHTMAVGYENHAIYVLNPSPNSELGIGLYYSLDETATWQESQLQGIEGNIIQIAVHPTDAQIVVAATEAGLFLSEDHGDSFERVGDAVTVVAAAFDPDGKSLYFGNNALYRYDLASQQIEILTTPSLATDDFIAYIAANPVNDELAFGTLGKDIYLSSDQGQTWRQIARQGEGLNS